MVMQELMGPVEIPHYWREFVFHRGCSVNVNSIHATGLVAGGRESKEGRQTFLFKHLNPFGENRDEEEPDGDLSKPKEVHSHSNRRHNQDTVYCVKLSRAQDQGVQFWQTRSNAIIEDDLVPANYIYKAISQNGDRILLERLSTPRPPLRVTLEDEWQTQQQSK